MKFIYGWWGGGEGFNMLSYTEIYKYYIPVIVAIDELAALESNAVQLLGTVVDEGIFLLLLIWHVNLGISVTISIFIFSTADVLLIWLWLGSIKITLLRCNDI